MSEMELTSKEKKLIDIIRETAFGEIKIVVQNGEPIRVEEIKKINKAVTDRKTGGH